MLVIVVVKVDEKTAQMLTLHRVDEPLGLIRMYRIAFGVHAMPGIYQRLMMSLLAGIEGVFAYWMM